MEGVRNNGANKAEISESLSELGYPVFLNGIILHAAERGTPDAVLQILEKLPAKEYPGEAEIIAEAMKIIGG